ncbi:MBL fold metallo-hydrolase [Rhodococcus sp. NPDC060090]|uniref:MBL fold metallo-hydrolase n=1 Tax=Rhodococcus sp. NPDC060090 TaxID=3347056 RepID=UPI00364E273C
MAGPGLWAILRGLRTPSLDPWRHLDEPATADEPGALRVSFLGVSTMLLTDGDTTILTDGFFTRPGLLRVKAGKVAPHRDTVESALRRFGVGKVDALFVVHSHFDHALDAPLVAELTGARLLGSESTRNIARGYGFPDSRVDVVVPGEPIEVGRFTLTPLPAVHSPGDLAPGRIEQPLAPGAKALDYRTGDCYALHIRHDDRTILIQASANMLAGDFDARGAETVYLGIGVLGKQDPEFREAYWRQFVLGTGARRVVPIHWDNFTVGLDRPLVPFPSFFDDFTVTMEFLTQRAAADGVEVAMPVLGRRTDPFRARSG